ncbi:hypothetical protein [Bacteroides reticulotermitis]|uniref:hypothetical protein n=1 Tax=Bacteroides reticulotermitis TaxID=1133319 RepID=UPI003F72ABD3
MGHVENAPAIDFDDNSWRSIDLPHDFQIEMPWEKSGNSQRGYKAMGEAGTVKRSKPILSGKESASCLILKVLCSMETYI